MTEEEIFAIINNHEKKHPGWFCRYVEPMRWVYEKTGALDEWEKRFMISIIDEHKMDKSLE